MTKEHDMSWYANFDIVLDGEEVDWFELDEVTQSYILEQIANGYMSGFTGGATRVDGK